MGTMTKTMMMKMEFDDLFFISLKFKSHEQTVLKISELIIIIINFQLCSLHHDPDKTCIHCVSDLFPLADS